MKLYDVPRGSKIKVISGITPPAAPVILEGDILKFSRLDGAYSTCFDSDGQRVYLSANAEVEIIK